MTIKLQNFINGEYREPIAAEAMDIFNPADGKVYAEAPISSAADVDVAFKSAEKAFESWRLSTPAERQLALLKIADAFEARAEERNGRGAQRQWHEPRGQKWEAATTGRS